MKTYVITTGSVFALLTVVHVWRVIRDRGGAAVGERAVVAARHGHRRGPGALGLAADPARAALMNPATTLGAVRRCCLPLSAAFALGLPLAACSNESAPSGGQDTQRAVLEEPAHVDAATFSQMVGELGVQIDPGVPEAEAESLQRLMSNSGFQIKAIRLTAPGKYTLDVWGVVPQAASEFTLERKGAGWEIVGDAPWVLIS